MRTGRKALSIAAITIGVLFTLLVVREAFFSYTVYLLIVPSARISTDGKPTSGWLHRGGRGRLLILTRNSSGNRESYWIELPNERGGFVSLCGGWTAPRFPLIPIGDWGPCLLVSVRRPSFGDRKSVV